MAYPQRQPFANPSHFEGPPQSTRDHSHNMYSQNEMPNEYQDGRQGDQHGSSGPNDFQHRGQQGYATQQPYHSGYQGHQVQGQQNDQGRGNQYSGPGYERNERYDERSYSQPINRTSNGRNGSASSPSHQSRSPGRIGYAQQGQRGGRANPPGFQGRRHVEASPPSPPNHGWDNPFPTFPKSGPNKSSTTTGDPGKSPSTRPRRRSYDSPRNQEVNSNGPQYPANPDQQRRAVRQNLANEIQGRHQDPRQASGRSPANDRSGEHSTKPRSRPPADHAYQQPATGNQRNQAIPTHLANDGAQFDLPVRGVSNSSSSARNAYNPNGTMPAGPRPMRNPDSRPPPSQRPNERWQHQGEQQNRAPDEDYEGLVDSYYDGPPRDEEMPNFDAVPGGHGHIDEDLHLGEGYGRANAPMPVDTDRGRPATDTRSFAGQAHRSRSQPNFRQQPPVPPPSTQPLGFDFGAGVQPQAIPEPNGQYHDPRNPLAPERSYSGSTSRSNGQRPLDAYSAGSGGPQQQYPARQDRSDAGQVRPYPGPRDPYGSSPGNPQTGPRPMPGPPQSAGRGRGQISAGYPGVTALARPSNPDALLEHPVPVRPGLMPINGAPPPPKQAPVRQYNNGPSPGMRSPPSSNPPSGQPAAEGPVTHEELQRLTQMVQTHPGDMVLQLVLAKKMVEAVSVLADDGGRADTKTRNRNRERYIFDAHKIIKKLVAAGDTEAIFYLADCHGRGLLGLQPDLKEAFNLYQSAAKLGHAQAAYRVAVCCELGQEDGGGTRRDPLKAIQWYKRAATLGDTPAMYKMGMIQLKGLLGQPKQPRDAVVWLKRAAEQADVENPHALHELGLLFESAGANDSIVRDDAYSRQLFHQAAALGYKFSQFRLGCAYEYGLMGLPIDPRQSIAWYSKAAVQEEHQSELALSGWYLTGAEAVLQQSDTEAYLWARKAAQAELAKAQYAMGYFTEVGIGAPANLEDAKRWYWRAASQNFPRARDRLEDLKKGGARMQKSRVSRSAMQKSEGDCRVM